MANIPLVCEDCGNIGVTDTLIGGSGSIKNLQLRNNVFKNSCSNCQGDMRTIDGLYEMSDGVISLIESPEANVEQANELLDILRQAREQDWSQEEIRSALESSAPSLSNLANYLPESAQARAAILMLLIELISFAKSTYYDQQSLEQDRRQHQERMEEMREHHQEMLNQAEEDTSSLDEEQVRELVNRIIEKESSD